ncbi:MAG: TIGR04282 family arsenosugar biosynthesis glycosyltransferase [Candidatus Thiodiazotropha sp. (ex Ctena orbiculata)]|nr:TIGR04282 family arsenosugar biosynthesis glycosyltransferase [Candidatus Thiodiazotropha taylori]MBT3035889.1 TIGR04282 family arsenosugar biosynthesis glycosyltransferase [Candidatus Thiodiazotropha taylori]MBV2135992.1 TIGR04282 family arsenosugar biosynthesis glycosyltransferase [Candidatus Thiodiazotropha taylori]
MRQGAVLIFAKAPIEGLVKTRLIPVIGEEAVTRLYTRLLVRVVDWICTQTPYAVELWVTPDREHPIWPRLAAQYDLSIQLQRGTDLGERMGSAAALALARHRHVALLGVDCPVLAAHHLHQAFDWLSDGDDAVLGPAEDGGYVLLGLNRYHRRLFEGHNWGGRDVAASTREALSALGWRWRELPELWDLDRPQDLQRLQLESPGIYQR